MGKHQNDGKNVAKTVDGQDCHQKKLVVNGFRKGKEEEVNSA